MSVVSLGDMARQFTTMRNSVAIRSELFRLNDRLSTGQVDDITTHLKGQTTRFTGVEHSLAQLDGYLQSANEASQTLSNIQTVMRRVDALRAEASSQLSLVTPDSQRFQIDEAARAASGSFDSMVNVLNTKLADRALMAGVDVVGSPLATAAEMRADLQAFVGGSIDQAAIIAAVEFWFDDPAGGFATMGYLGDTGEPLEKRVAENDLVQIDARADDPAIKETLKAAALAALANELPGLSDGTKSGLLQESAARLFGASSGLVAVQSRIGFVEETVERVTVEMRAQRTALAITRNEMISADPFDTASRLQAVQQNLEMHYTVTARMSQLSLLGYI